MPYGLWLRMTQSIQGLMLQWLVIIFGFYSIHSLLELTRKNHMDATQGGPNQNAHPVVNRSIDQ